MIPRVGIKSGSEMVSRMSGLLRFLMVLFLIVPLAAAAKDIDQDEAKALRQQGAILPLEKILQAAQSVHPGRVIKVELEEKKRGRYVYEVEIADNNGQVWEMKFNASDATLLSDERED
jgi:uncharacterized membrane protein YkoI